MKTVKKENRVKRVSDRMARTMLLGGWKYCPKSERKNPLMVFESKRKV
jgi:hypothetical protein